MTLRMKRLLLWLIILDIALYQLLPLEVYGWGARYFIYSFIWISVFIIALALLPSKKSTGRTVYIVAGSLFYALLTCILAFVFFLFCRWSKHAVLYTSKTNSSLKIVCRTYDCYGTAEDCRKFKQRELLPNIYWLTDFSDKPVDSAVWKKNP